MQSQAQKDLEAWRRFARRAQSRNFEAKSSFYIKLLSALEAAGHRKVGELTPLSGQVLELGPGGGQHLPFQRKPVEFSRYVAAEVNEEFVILLSEFYPQLKVSLYDGRILPYPDNTFSACLALSVLEHVVDLEKLISEVDRVMKPEGIFLAVVPSNGMPSLQLFKRLVSYPALRNAGIKAPELIWHYENVNSLSRVEAIVSLQFSQVETQSLPFKFVPRWLSPMRLLVCRKKGAADA